MLNDKDELWQDEMEDLSRSMIVGQSTVVLEALMKDCKTKPLTLAYRLAKFVRYMDDKGLPDMSDRIMRRIEILEEKG